MDTREVPFEASEGSWTTSPNDLRGFFRTVASKYHFRGPKSMPTRTWNWASILRDIIVYTFAFWGLVSMLRYFPATTRLDLNSIAVLSQQQEGCDCGGSVVDAMALGCKFDALSMAWLPEHCRDDDLTAEFNTAGTGPNGSWVYYADTAHTIEVPAAAVAVMGDDPSARVHMDKTWHRVHCVFYWLKLHRSWVNGKIVEPRSDTEGHIRHCGMVFAEPGYGTISGVALNTNEVVVE